MSPDAFQGWWALLTFYSIQFFPRVVGGSPRAASTVQNCATACSVETHSASGSASTRHAHSNLVIVLPGRPLHQNRVLKLFAVPLASLPCLAMFLLVAVFLWPAFHFCFESHFLFGCTSRNFFFHCAVNKRWLIACKDISFFQSTSQIAGKFPWCFAEGWLKIT